MNLATTNLVFLSEFTYGQPLLLANSIDGFLSDFCGWIGSAKQRLFHTWTPCAPLVLHISHVLQLRSLFEMVRIYAKRFVADVHNDVSRRNLAVKHLIRQSMRGDCFVGSQNMISGISSIVGRLPNPTTIVVNGNSFQESVLNLVPNNVVELCLESHVPPIHYVVMALYHTAGQRASSLHVRREILSRL